MLTNENNRENHPIFYQIYDIQAEVHNQEKQITLCKVLAHIGIEGNGEVDKAAKQAIGIPGMSTTRLPQTDYYLTIRRVRNSEWQREWEKLLVSYTTLNHISKNGKVPTTTVSNTRLN